MKTNGRLRLMAELFFAALLTITLPAWSAKLPAPPKPRNLTVLYTCQAHGMVRSCNCTKFRYGGYGRQDSMVAKTRRTVRDMVLVEGGDLVGLFRAESDKLKAGVAIRSLKMMGYDAITPGEAEASAGLDQVQAFAPQPAPSFVIANLRTNAPASHTGAKPFVVRKTTGGLRVAIIGLLSPRLLQDTPLQKVTPVTDPLAAYRKVLPAARKAADFVLVVSHSTRDEALAIARSGGADMVICAHFEGNLILPTKQSYTVDAPVEKIGSCVFVMSGTRSAWSVGRVDLELNKGKVSTFSHRLCYLDRSYPESPRIVKLYDGYNQRVREVVLNQQNKLKSDTLARLAKRGYHLPKVRARAFAGSAACKTCHQAAYDVWAKSKHATAFATLRKTKQEYDPDCVSCHTTGASTLGGFVNAKDTPDLENVQCEACHGAGVSHAANPVGPYSGKVDEELCRGCHTDEYNPDFDYEQRWKPIEH